MFDNPQHKFVDNHPSCSKLPPHCDFFPQHNHGFQVKYCTTEKEPYGETQSAKTLSNETFLFTSTEST